MHMQCLNNKQTDIHLSHTGLQVVTGFSTRFQQLRGQRVNLYELAMMDAPSIDLPYCPFCGRRATQRHHIVFKSQGGKSGPTVTVCGMGNASGCHGDLHHHRLHMKYEDGEWWYLRTEEITKYDDALLLPGWKKIDSIICYETGC